MVKLRKSSSGIVIKGFVYKGEFSIESSFALRFVLLRQKHLSMQCKNIGEKPLRRCIYSRYFQIKSCPRQLN